MAVTAGSRFNAAKRLQGRDRRMALVVALASAFVIALTFIPFVYRLPPMVTGDLSVTTLIMSVIILAVSLIQYSNNDAMNAEQHHRSGLEINALHHELAVRVDNLNTEGVEKIGERYAHILQKYSVNHEDIDWDKYRVEHPETYQLTKGERLLIHLRLFIARYWLQGLMSLMIMWFLFIVFWHVIPARLAT